MSKQRFALFITAILLSLASFHIVSAAGMEIIPTPTDVPPGTMSYGNIAKSTGLDPNIVAALIGVIGILVGSFLTILGTYFLRFLDVRREDKREEAFMVRERKEKEFQIKQEIYKNFLTDLGLMEGFLLHKSENVAMKDVESFNAEWTKMEIKMNLVCSTKIRQLLDEVQEELLSIAKERFDGGKAELSQTYMAKRGELLDAIREDIDLFQTA
jgi:hypothetical protein